MTPALLPLLLACSSPTVTLETSAHPDAPVPGKLTELLDRQFRRPIQGCYEKALEADSSLVGTVTYQVMGSHGVLKADLTGPGPEALNTCAKGNGQLRERYVPAQTIFRRRMFVYFRVFSHQF